MDIIARIEKKTGAKLIPLTMDKFFENTPGYLFDKDENIIGLNLQDLKLSGIEFLKDMGNLLYLNLRTNRISDLSPLKYLVHLETLFLDVNKISDISVLKDVPKLTVLTLGENKISDISALKRLENLAELDLSSNKISDISALKNLLGLTHLSLMGNKISDISPLKCLTALNHLELSNNRLTNLSGIVDLVNLTYLSVEDNPVSDFTPLKYLKDLKDFYLTENREIRFPPEIDKFKVRISMMGIDRDLVKIKTRKDSYKKKVRSRVYREAGIPCLVFALIAFGFSAYQGFKRSKKNLHLFEHGVKGVATVIAKEEKNNDGDVNYYIRYSYYDKTNNSYGDRKLIDSYKEWVKIKIGQTMDVTYDPDNPEIHRPFIIKKNMIYQPLYGSILFAAIVVGMVGVVFGFIFIVDLIGRKRK